LRALRRQAKVRGILLICDEVGTGVFRTGPFLSSASKGIRPDVIVCGKALTNGLYPLSLCLVAKEFASLVDAASFTSTYGGTSAGCAAALATLDYHVEHEVERKVRAEGPRLRRKLEDTLGGLRIVREIRGEGFELAISLDNDYRGPNVRPSALLARLRKCGLFAACSASGEDLMFMPPLTTDLNLLLDAVDRIAGTLDCGA
jgi:acetylornithine/succinyldiaminopimelate/putrescine aminotransferase